MYYFKLCNKKKKEKNMNKRIKNNIKNTTPWKNIIL